MRTLIRPPFPSRALVCLLLALPFAGLPAEAARSKPTRIEAVVSSPDGDPLAGVAVRVTSPDAPELVIETTTDAKGRFSVELEQPRLSYVWTLSAEGYDTLITTLEILPELTVSYDLTMPSLDSPESRKRRAIETYNRGVEQLQAGEAESALATFEQAAELDPELAEAKRAIAEAALAGNRPELAARAAEDLLAADAASLSGLRLLLESALALGDDERLAAAVAGIEAALAGAPGAVEVGRHAAVLVFNDGVTRERAGEAALAIERFAQATRLDPTLAPAHAALAARKLESGDAAGALASADRLLELVPDDVQGLRLRLAAAQALGDEPKTAEALAALGAAAPESAVETLLRQADERFKAGDLTTAKKLLGEVLELDPDSPEAHYTLALCLLNEGQTIEARKHFDRVIELAPDTSWASDAREMVEHLR